MMTSASTSSASSPADYRDFLSTSSAVHSVTATKFCTRVWGKSFDKITSKQTYESDTESFQYRSFRVPLLEFGRSKEEFVIFNEYEAVWNDILQLRFLRCAYPSGDTITHADMDGSVIQDITTDSRKVRLPTVIGVVGHPGIGKSIWLLYVLLRLLCASQPVLFPTDSEYDLFFCARGAYKIPHKDAVAVICDFLGPECWALVDAKYDVPERFRRSKLSIIQASSPREDRLHWLKKRNATRRYFMSPPSLQEYLAAYVNPSSVEGDMDHSDPFFSFYRCYTTRRVPLKQPLFRSSYEKFGPSIRLALHSCRSSEAYDLKTRELVADINSMDYDRFSEMVRCSHFLDATPHKLFVTRPCRRREEHRLEYVSPFVEMLIRDQLQTAWANNCADFISICHPSSTSRCLAAPAVELAFHSRLVKGGQFYLTPLANRGRQTLGRWSTEKVTVKWESDIGHAPTHVLAIGRHRDEEEVSVTLHPSSDSAPHFVSSASALSMLPRKIFSPANPPVATFTAYWQPAAIDPMAFDSLIFDATTNTVFLFQLEVIEASDAKASSVLFVREHFPNATVHYILVSSSIFAETAFGEATSRWLPNKWHLRV